MIATLSGPTNQLKVPLGVVTLGELFAPVIEGATVAINGTGASLRVCRPLE